MWIIEKSKKYHSGKLEVDFLWNRRKILKNFSRHNSMTKLCRSLFKYENERKIGWYNWLKTL